MPLVLRIGGWRRGRIIALMDWRPGILAVLPLRMADSRYPFHSACPEGRGWYNFAKAVDWTGRQHSHVPGLQNAIAIISPVAAIAAAVIALMRVLGRLDRRLDHIEISIHGRKPKSCTPNRFPIPSLKP